MVSKLVVDRQRAARAAASSAAVHADEAAAGLAGWLAAYLEPGERFPDVALLMRLLQRALADHSLRLVAADEARVAGRLRTQDPRRRREAAVARVRDKLLALRTLFKGIFGREGDALLQLAGRIPEDPNALRRQAARTVAALRQTVDWPARRLNAEKEWRPQALAESLAKPLRALDEALDDLVARSTVLDGMSAAKATVMAEFDLTLGRAAPLIEVHLDAAGMGFAAERVRRRRSRRGRRRPGPARRGT